MSILGRLWRELRCKAHEYEWRNNVHGDAINALNCRSIWVCKHCGKWDYRRELHMPPTKD